MGTETSKYRQEEKTIVIAQVVVSERAIAQTYPAFKGDIRWQEGVVGHRVAVVSHSREVTKCVLNRTVLERRAIVGDSPVGEKDTPSFRCSRVPRSTWNSVGSWEDHLSRLNTCQ